MAKASKLVIDAWPQLIDALNQQKMLGDTPEEVARFLLVQGLEERRREQYANKRARHAMFASGYRGPD